MNLTKRQTLIGIGSGVGAAALGTSASFALPNDHAEILRLFRHNYRNLYPESSNFYPMPNKEIYDFSWQILEQMVKQNYFKLSSIMTSPCDLLYQDDGIAQPIAAVSRHFKCQYGLSLLTDKPTHLTTEMVAVELISELDRYRHKRYEYYPYIPVAVVRMIDPGTFQPVIGFKTRYATNSIPGKINNKIHESYK